MFVCTAAVKLSMGGETANQSTVIEATIKKWFCQQADAIKKKKEEEQKKEKEKAMAQAYGDWPPLPVMELSVPEAQALGDGDGRVN